MSPPKHHEYHVIAAKINRKIPVCPNTLEMVPRLRRRSNGVEFEAEAIS